MKLDPALLTRLAAEKGTPLYVYDVSVLRETVDRIQSAFPYTSFQLLFATMANDNPEVLRIIASKNVGACVNSIKHLMLATDCGFKCTDIQYTSTGISISDLRRLQEMSITVNLDSPSQVARYFSAGQGRAVGVRVNAGALLGRSSLDCDRIGMDRNGIEQAKDVAKLADGKINGVHIYCGTNFRQPDIMLDTLSELFNSLGAYGDLEYVNIGGGIGVDYCRDGIQFDIAKFGVGASQLCDDTVRRLGRPLHLVFEPGRGTVANCGKFITRVTDVKRLNGHRYVSVDASISIFPRPFHHPNLPHAVSVVGCDEARGSSEEAIIAGPTTFSGDILGRCELPSVNIGDLLVFDDAGAYSQSMMMQFLGQMFPECAIIGDDSTS